MFRLPISVSLPRVRRAFLPALLALFSISAAALLAGSGPTAPRVEVNRNSDGQIRVNEGPREEDPADAVPAGILPGEPGPAMPGPASFNPVKISIEPEIFNTIRPEDFIVREINVQNDSPTPANVTVVMRFTARNMGQSFSRSVTTTRQVPPGTRQTIPVFIPPSELRLSYNSDYFNSANPQVFVNGRPYEPLPPGFHSGLDVSRMALPLPSSFSNQERLAEYLDELITSHRNAPFIQTPDWRGEMTEACISGPDTIQWPSIPQFYQSKYIIFRKSTDQFTPDAERAIRDAVMLGATEVYLVMPGSPWPEWASRPASPMQPSIVARGLGQSIAIDARGIRQPAPPVTTAPGGQRFTFDEDEEWNDEKWAPSKGRWNNNGNDINRISAQNPVLSAELKSARIWAVDPATVFLTLPHITTPSIPFIVVLAALLAYVIIVGPVNYFLLIRRKKRSVLLLLLTVPLISLIFVAVVIVFAGTVEGWSSRASAVGVTFLDQKENMAYTRAGVNLYAPVPVRRLVFDPADSVLFSSPRDIHISLGRDQVITGTNRARIPLSYAISRAEKRLEQLKITRDANGGLTVMNGLGVPVNKLMVKTENGRLWQFPGVITPGESVRPDRVDRAPMTQEDLHNTILKAVRQNNVLLGKSKGRESDAAFSETNNLLLTASALLLEMEPGVKPADRDKLLPESRFGAFNEISGIYAAKELFRMQPDILASILPPGMYMAETDRPLFYTPGCNPVSFRARHIVFGTFTAQEATNEN